MKDRLGKLNERIEASRSLLRWFGVMAAGTVFAAIAVTGKAHAGPQAEEGLMLRPGVWTQDPGSYILPAALGGNPRDWPAAGWYRVTNKESAVQVLAVAAPERGLPEFLHEIAVQVINPAAPAPTRGEAEAEAIDTRYIRLPDAALAEGRLPVVKFPRGVLTPRMDHAYDLRLGDTPFTLTVQNGLRNKAGVAYGHGAVYTVRMGEDSYSFHVEASRGWETTVVFATDLDSDGKPDFIVQSGGQETLLMSSRARAGLTPPAAALALMNEGC